MKKFMLLVLLVINCVVGVVGYAQHYETIQVSEQNYLAYSYCTDNYDLTGVVVLGEENCTTNFWMRSRRNTH